MDSVLRSVFSQLLTDSNEAEMSRLVDAVLAAGVRAEQDLCLVGEDDVKSVLPPIQMRKFLAGLKAKYGMYIFCFIFY
jgi:hypothetical protein